MKAQAEDALNLHNIHRMYVDLAKNITDKNNGIKDNHDNMNGNNGNGSDNGRGLTSSQKKKEMDRQSYNGDSYTPNRIPMVSFDDNGNGNGNNGNGNNGNGNGRYDGEDSFNGNYSASFIAGSYTPNNNPRGSGSGSGLQGVIYSLEEEFTALNDQYRSLLSSIKGNSPGSSLEIMKEEELVSIIQKLHKKGEQLRSLKSPNK